MDHDDRRAYERHPLWAQVMIVHGKVDHVLDVINLSRGGALIDLGSLRRPRWLEIGRAVEVKILGTNGASALACTATVVRVMEARELRTFAVQFEAILDDERVRAVLRDAGRPPPLP